MTRVTIIFFQITFRQTSLSFKKIFLLKTRNINVKWRSDKTRQEIALSRLSHTSVLPSFFPAVLLRKLTINSNIPRKLIASDRGQGRMVVKKQIRTPKATVKRDNKNVQLVSINYCKSSWKAMLRVLPSSFNPALQQITTGCSKLHEYWLLIGWNYMGVTPHEGVYTSTLAARQVCLW